MGLFQHKKSKDEEAAEQEQHFLDENFREELRNHARLYFEKVLSENGEIFKADLKETVTQLNTDLKDHISAEVEAAIAEVKTEIKGHVAHQLDEQFAEHIKTMKEAQDAALQAMTKSAQDVQQQHKKLVEGLQKSISDQDAAMTGVLEETKTKMATISNTQTVATQWLNQSAQALQEQYQKLAVMLQENIDGQEDMLVGAFEQNMATIIEHYLLTSIGDQYDLKAQLPSIVKQMEANKQAIVDDMKL